MDDTDKVQIFWKDALVNCVEVLPPDVNASAYRFEPVPDAYSAQGQPPRTMPYGLRAVKGTGPGAGEAIIRIRNAGGPLTSLFEFCRRGTRHTVNLPFLESMLPARSPTSSGGW